MKIEKISDTQIKFILSEQDLKERNIKLAELAYGSEKTQALFKEIMEQAVETCGFEVDNVPLMIEAVPVESESIMIIVSKVSNSAEIENKFNLAPPSKDSRKFKRKPISEELNISVIDDDKVFIYSFNSLDDVISASVRLNDTYTDLSTLFKYNNSYFLVLEQQDTSKTDLLDIILAEYGQKHISTVISKYYLIEHGEIIIKDSAINVLATL